MPAASDATLLPGHRGLVRQPGSPPLRLEITDVLRRQHRRLVYLPGPVAGRVRSRARGLVLTRSLVKTIAQPGC